MPQAGQGVNPSAAVKSPGARSSIRLLQQGVIPLTWRGRHWKPRRNGVWLAEQRQHETPALTDPRLLLLDFTAITGAAATSTLKAAYLIDWREDALLHVMEAGDGRLGLAAAADAQPRPLRPGETPAHEIVDAFKPEIVLYRPVLDSKMFHHFAMTAIKESAARRAGLALWIMDDWPERLRTSDPVWFAEIDADLRELFKKSAVNFAISEGMAEAFGKRYGASFHVAHNGVRTKDWPTRNHPERRDVLIRYAGSLAPETTQSSVADAARAVSVLARQGVPVRMEGRTQAHWMAPYGKALNTLAGVSFAASAFDEAAYRRWLSEADILLVAYNFDDATRAYLKYSFANKVPETMAAGAAILAYGPEDLESLSCLKRSGAALVVADPDPAALEAAIASLAQDAAKREALGAAARAFAFRNFDLARMKRDFRSALAGAAARAAVSTIEAARTDKIQFEECRCVFELLNARDKPGVMIDVGAHTGGSLLPFARAGWRVFAFEPDRKNRAALDAAARELDNVNIDARAVGAQEAADLPFYDSDVSTGISGLTPFHESHKTAGRVDMTTLDALIQREALTSVDFLKIDVEGHEMSVLNGLDFGRLKPRAIVAEFEDGKTRTHGFVMDDLARTFLNHGYVVFVSEWHPVERYGVKHSWRRLAEYPCETAPNAWGNLIALLERPSKDDLEAACGAALSGGPYSLGAGAAMLAVAGAPPPPSAYRRIAEAVNNRTPALAARLRPLARWVRALAGRARSLLLRRK